MPRGILVLFSAVLCLGVLSVVAVSLREVIKFRWNKARGLLRFSLAGLMGITGSIALALGVYRFQRESESVLEFSFPLILATCFGMCAIAFAIAHDFRRRRRRTALDSYRQRNQDVPLVIANSRQPSSKRRENPKPRKRKKWWLRRRPNRFHSISHRDMQIDEPSGYYIRDD